MKTRIYAAPAEKGLKSEQLPSAGSAWNNNIAHAHAQTVKVHKIYYIWKY